MYADTDFFLALLKGEDWLKEKAIIELNNYRGSITTSFVTIVELLFASKKYNMDPEDLFHCVYAISDVIGVEEEKALAAAHLVKKKNVSACNALHACMCGGTIISSDNIFDGLGIFRVKLER